MFKFVRGFLGTLLVPGFLLAQTSAVPTNVHVNAGLNNALSCTHNSSLTGSEVYASSSSRAAVVTAVGTATSGQTVCITSTTSATWSPVVSITKAIHLKGPGKSSLTITGGVSYEPTSGEISKTFELDGFTFNGNQGFHAEVPSTTSPITGLKIHDNAFNNASVRAIQLQGMEWGVIYSNTFSNDFIAVSVIGVGFPGMTYAHAFGTVNNLYVEDNDFGQGTGEFISETGQGGRLAFRHNTSTGYACTGCEIWDVHGDQNSGGGTSISEYYHNTMNVGSSGTNRWMHHRGGQAVIMNNTISRNIDFNYSEYRAWGQNGYCTTYPVAFSSDVTPDNTNRCSPANGTTCIETQIFNSFYYNNFAGGLASNPVFSNGDNTGSCGSTHESQYIQEGREYWKPTSGLESALPGTCTADNSSSAYYGTTDTDKIYKCTSTNTWTIFFTPYTYPHPLRS